MELSSGYNEITMNFISPYFKEGLILTGTGIIGFLMILIREKHEHI